MLISIQDMGLQNFFYIFAIVFMSLYLIILIIVVVGVFYIKSKIDALYNTIESKLDDLKHKPADVAMDLGTSVALGILKKIRKLVF